MIHFPLWFHVWRIPMHLSFKALSKIIQLHVHVYACTVYGYMCNVRSFYMIIPMYMYMYIPNVHEGVEGENLQ